MPYSSTLSSFEYEAIQIIKSDGKTTSFGDLPTYLLDKDL